MLFNQVFIVNVQPTGYTVIYSTEEYLVSCFSKSYIQLNSFLIFALLKLKW